MKPLIVNYRDYSSISTHSIKPRFEAVKTFKKKRRYKSPSFDPNPLVLYKPKDQMSTRPLCILEAAQPPKTSTPKPRSSRKKIKPALSRDQLAVLPWDSPSNLAERSNWLFRNAKPETHFRSEDRCKKIPLSRNALELKQTLKPRSLSHISKNVSGKDESLEAIIDDILDNKSEVQEPPQEPPQEPKKNPIEKYFPVETQFNKSEYKAQFNPSNTYKAFKKMQQHFLKSKANI